MVLWVCEDCRIVLLVVMVRCVWGLVRLKGGVGG